MYVRGKTAQRRSGVVLLAVLVVIVILALAGYQYAELAMAEYKASEYAQRQAQARALADSGIHYAAALLADPDSLKNIANGNPYHNAGLFANVAVPGDARRGFPGRFTLLAPADPADSSVRVRHGVTDETGKINLNALMQIDPSGQAAHDTLMKLPNMTEEIASCIVDWLDADDQARTDGAENDYYTGLNPPYRAKNGPLESIEELLLVKGVTPQLLFGNDRNRNGVLDDGEDGDSSGTLDRGWYAYLTIYSRELLVDSTGQPLIDLNGSDLTTLYQDLSTAVGDDLAKYIVLYRQFGAASASGGSQSLGRSVMSLLGGSSGSKGKSSSSAVAGMLSDLSVDMKRAGSQKLSSFFALVDSQISIPGKDAKSPPKVFTSPLKDPGVARQLLPLLFDKTTVRSGKEIPARINVNTAPAEVLAAIPGLVDADVQSILGARPSLTSSEAPADIFRTPAWLYTEASIKPATLLSIEKYVTTRAQVFRVQSVGILDGAGPSARVEAVIDTNGGQPRIVTWRDLTELGKGWNLE